MSGVLSTTRKISRTSYDERITCCYSIFEYLWFWVYRCASIVSERIEYTRHLWEPCYEFLGHTGHHQTDLHKFYSSSSPFGLFIGSLVNRILEVTSRKIRIGETGHEDNISIADREGHRTDRPTGIRKPPMLHRRRQPTPGISSGWSCETLGEHLSCMMIQSSIELLQTFSCCTRVRTLKKDKRKQSFASPRAKLTDHTSHT